jgi:histidine ammonia-lyase
MAGDLEKATALVAAGALPATAISVLKDNPFPILAETRLAERGYSS